MRVDERGDITFFQPVIFGITLYDKQALVIVPRVDFVQMGIRSTLEAAARTVLMGITNIIGKKMLVIQLRVECRINVCLCMVDIVNVVQHILPRIGRTTIIARQCEIILKQACVVDLDIPVRVLVAPVPTDVVGVAP